MEDPAVCYSEMKGVVVAVEKAILLFKETARCKKYDAKCLQLAKIISCSYCSLEDAPIKVRKELRLRVVKRLLKEDVLSSLSNTLWDILDTCLAKRSGDHKEIELCVAIVILIAVMFQNFTDFSSTFALAVCKNQNVRKSVLKVLRELLKDHMDGKLCECFNDILETALTLIYNISMHNHPECIEILRDGTILTRVRPYTKSACKDIQIISIMCLAYIETDAVSMALTRSSEDIIDYFVGNLRSAMESEERRFDGFSTTELLRDLEKLAMTKENQKHLMKLDVTSLIRSILEDGHLSEEKAAMRLILQLSSNSSHVAEIRMKLYILVSILTKQKRSKSLSKNAKSLIENLKPSRGSASSVRQQMTNPQSAMCLFSPRSLPPPYSSLPNVDNKHIMISYTWSDQTEVFRIKDFLVENGFQVWIDQESIGTDKYDSLAKAVQDAWLVLLAVSEKYQHSPDCKGEVSYARELKKDIIPLKMEDFQPVDWLGFVISHCIWQDFRRGYSKEAAQKLLKEVKKIYVSKVSNNENFNGTLTGIGGLKESDESWKLKEEMSESSLPSSPRSKLTRKQVGELNEVDAKKWLCDNGIPWSCNRKITGDQILCLAKMKENAPESFFRYIKDDMEMHSLAQITEFTNLLDQFS